MSERLPLRTILVASDLQATSNSVTGLAGRFARDAGGAEVLLFHVVEEGGEGGDAERALEVQADGLREQGIRVAGVRTVRHRSPHRAILDELEAGGSDLVVVGTHSRRKAPHRLGSTADRLLRSSPVPCLVVRGVGEKPGGIRRAGVLCDGSAVARGALRVAFDWLPRLGAGTAENPLEVLRVGNPEVRGMDPDYEARLEGGLEAEIVRAGRWEEDQAEREGREDTDDDERAGSPAARGRILWGHHVLDRVLEEAEDREYDLLVAGTHGGGAVVRWLVGSVTLGLAQAAPCPVLVVPPPGVRRAREVPEAEEGLVHEGETSPVTRIMTSPVVTVPLGTSLADAARTMLERDLGSVLCLDEGGRIRGIVTDRDFAARTVGIPFSTFRVPQLLGRWLDEGGVERIYREARERTVDEIMSEPVHSVDEDGTVEEVLELMLKRNVKHVPVVRDGQAVGMVARHDLLKFLLARLRP